MSRTSIALLALLWACLLTPFVMAEPDEKEPADIPLADVREHLEEETAVIIDVREPREWQQGHLSEARLISLTELNQEKDPQQRARKLAKRLPKEGTVLYTYCRSGVRSFMAAELLEPLGYEVRPLRAGYADLVEFGFPHVVPEDAPKRQ